MSAPTVIWSGAMERSGEAVGLSSPLFRRSIAASCADRGSNLDAQRNYGPRPRNPIPNPRPCVCRCRCRGIVTGREVIQSLKRCLACRRGRTLFCSSRGLPL